MLMSSLQRVAAATRIIGTIVGYAVVVMICQPASAAAQGRRPHQLRVPRRRRTHRHKIHHRLTARFSKWR